MKFDAGAMFSRALVPAGLGALGGLLASVPSRAPAPSPTPRKEEGGASRDVALALMRSVVSAAARSSGVQLEPAPAPSTAPPSAADEPPPTDELGALRIRHREEHEERLSRHREEAIDAAWARPTETALAADLEDLGHTSLFSVVRVDCRTTSCAAVLEWASYGDSIGRSLLPVTHFYSVNCARAIYLPEPENERARYQATLTFDCNDLRAR